MEVKLIRHTAFPEMLAGEAAALCYNGKNPERSLKVAMNGHHESVVEHVTFTFLVEDVSRVLLAQLTRHRLASFSVQSQRYCGANPNGIIPKTIAESRWNTTFANYFNRSYEFYEAMVKAGIPEEDARYIIPQCVTCRLMITMNVRELRHFFSLRCCTRAQWEIRELATEMLKQCKEVAPVLFNDAGPGCVRGACPEGAKSCQRKKEV